MFRDILTHDLRFQTRTCSCSSPPASRPRSEELSWASGVVSPAWPSPPAQFGGCITRTLDRFCIVLVNTPIGIFATVGAAAGEDQQLGGVGVVAPAVVEPPSGDVVAGEAGGVVAGADEQSRGWRPGRRSHRARAMPSASERKSWSLTKVGCWLQVAPGLEVSDKLPFLGVEAAMPTLGGVSLGSSSA